MKTMGAILAAVMVAGLAMGQETVTPRVGVDILEVKERGFMATAKDNWGKWLLGIVAGGIAIDRAAENNGWLWHKNSDSGDSGDTRQPAGNTTGGDAGLTQVTVVAGDNSPVTVRIEYIETNGK